MRYGQERYAGPLARYSYSQTIPQVLFEPMKFDVFLQGAVYSSAWRMNEGLFLCDEGHNKGHNALELVSIYSFELAMQFRLFNFVCLYSVMRTPFRDGSGSKLKSISEMYVCTGKVNTDPPSPLLTLYWTQLRLKRDYDHEVRHSSANMKLYENMCHFNLNKRD